MSVQFKVLKARVKLFFTKSRFIESYKNKKRLLVLFLLVVNAFIGWSVSMNVPEMNIDIKWSNEPIVYVQPARASVEPLREIVKNEPVVLEKSIEELADYVWFKESTRGKNNFSKCEAIGKVNGVGYAIPGDGSYMCFNSHEEEMTVLKGWLTAKRAAGMSDLAMLCLYSGSNYQECK